MARKTFTLNTEPHVAEIGEMKLLFHPEVYGDEFLEAYEGLQEAQRAVGIDVSNLSNVDPAQLRDTVTALRVFLARLMLPESAEQFARWDVVKAGKVVGSFTDPEKARENAEGAKNAKVVDASMRLPDRVLVELLEWAVELYAGGGSRPPTSSSGSSPASRPPGTPGRANSRSKASTSARGR